MTLPEILAALLMSGLPVIPLAWLSRRRDKARPDQGPYCRPGSWEEWFINNRPAQTKSPSMTTYDEIASRDYSKPLNQHNTPTNLP